CHPRYGDAQSGAILGQPPKPVSAGYIRKVLDISNMGRTKPPSIIADMRRRRPGGGSRSHIQCLYDHDQCS
ncbi:hypothetical protein, partial [Endozoicomonas sp. ONNA2]|uniref:hypothetical protein n=1 Tax=Endozoicomonas sp. ONNA2 TaxID=2828741 RepID=UPI002147C995